MSAREALAKVMALFSRKPVVAPPPTQQEINRWYDLRQKCEGFDDPEERCPRNPDFCVCWRIRVRVESTEAGRAFARSLSPTEGE